MTNEAIADNFSLLGKLMDIHGENSFKTKSYAMAAYTIEKLPAELVNMPEDKIFAIKGIGSAIGQKIIEQIETGKLTLLGEYIANTPPGILEMLSIKGIGPKKIATIWKELGIETIGELLYACEENRLMLYKGFGEKTQQSIKESINFYLGSQGSYLYQQIENFAINVEAKLKAFFKNPQFYSTGAFKRQMEVIDTLDWVTTTDKNTITSFFTKNGYEQMADNGNYASFKGPENITLGFYTVTTTGIYSQLFATSCIEAFFEAWQQQFDWDANAGYPNEEAIFAAQNINYIPPCLRETAEIIKEAKQAPLPSLIQTKDIKGIIHSHSKWSDGANTLDEMAKAAITKGYEYLVISDHSKTAFYAQGLSVERVLAQQEQIEELNTQFAPFKIFKSIESDILNDGSLDYEPEILARFDVVIASIHSNLKMQEDKAMLRLLNAIENPYTSILGHMTGRLLLSRNGYPVNHAKIIDACAANNVVIELNAHPRRLDIDWRWIKAALDKNVLISINPDAHSTDGYNDCRYGVLAAQKAGLAASQNLSSFSLTQFEAFVEGQKKKRG
ncbi:helix-hairpin-helix domain-containing protein [Parasediminibacterium sp. JCM 36343]|uniref:helix-hairpin-helix domain-containing protein n=1 Tax=Parasediminibacterium sp. JCM 36343 TaxID=3374279 RepID=UPI00397CBD9E